MIMKQDLLLLIENGDFTGFVRQFCAEYTGTVWSDKQQVFDSICSTYKEKPMTVDGLTVTLVDSQGGEEGDGEYVERNFRIDDGETGIAHFQITGCYTSDYGTEWDIDAMRVYPKEVMVIQYVTSP